MRSARMAPLLGLTLCFFLAAASPARDIRVPQDEPTLAAALAAAEAGDRIILTPGRHEASGLLLVDGVTILGDADDPGAVIIDGRQEGAIFLAEGVDDALLEGLTITGGLADGGNTYDGSGGALLISHSRIRLRAVHFVGNRAAASGGAIRVGRGDLEAVDCLFADNHALKGGGAVDLSYEATARFFRGRFVDNSAAWGGAISVRSASSCWLTGAELSGNRAVPPQEMGGAFFSDYAATVAFTSCILADNAARLGGAARLNGVDTAYANCTVDGNRAREGGGAFMVSGTELILYRSIVSFNEGSALSGVLGSLVCIGSNIYGNAEGDWIGDLDPWRGLENNLSSDPLFCDEGSYYLQDDSPCAEGNNPLGLIGALPAGCDEVSLFLQSFTADRQDRRIDLDWSVTPGDHAFRLQGQDLADPGAGTWTVDYRAQAKPGSYAATDTPPASAGALRYELAVRRPDGEWAMLGALQVDQPPALPGPPLTLDSVHPNPFNPLVNIHYTLAHDALVRAAVYDVQGRLLDDLALGRQPAGAHHLTWDGRDRAGRTLPTGSYLLRIEAGGVRQGAKLLLVR